MTTTPVMTTLLFAVTLGAAACGNDSTASPGRGAAAVATDPVERGGYLVNAGGCDDCHTPLVMGAKGPERDRSRRLSGHPQDMVMPTAPAPQGPWLYSAAATMTAWSGPWGVSFTANLTPDDETGLGTWTAQTFIDTIRNGRHMGKGRQLLPPMPADVIANYSDEDLAAIFAYLQRLPAVKNKVPAPIPPAT